MRAHSFVPPSLQAAEGSAPDEGARRIEALALLVFALGAFLGLSLLTLRIDPLDPSAAGLDLMGAVGRVVASLVARAFGFGAWLLPLELSLMGLPLLRRMRPTFVGLRLAGDLVLLVLASSLLQVALPGTEVFGGVEVGGSVGLVFGELMRGLFSAPGSFLVGFTVIGLILIGRSSFSFIEWVERTEVGLRKLSALLRRALVRGAEIWASARQLRLERANEAKHSAEPTVTLTDPTAAILHHLADESPWVPLEVTGVPPLALSRSLRSSLVAEGLQGDEGDPIAVHAGGDRGGAMLGASAALMDDLEGFFSAPGAGDFVRAGDAGLGAALTDDGGFGRLLDAAEATDDGDEMNDTAAARAFGSPEATAGGAPKTLHLEPRIVEKKADEKRHEAPRNAPAKRQAGYQLPSTELLEEPSCDVLPVDRQKLLALAETLEKTLLDYGVVGKVEEIHPGPTLTTFEFAPTSGTKVSKVAGLVDDLALGLSRKVRIIAPIPGKSRIGFELPNDVRQPVNLRELVEDERFDKLAQKVPLPVVLGRDIVGAPFYADLASMPHVIVAGATGAGKSVGLNVMLSSLLFRRSPEELRLLMIDPKVVELAPFDKIPHLLLPVVTDMKQAAQALKWAVDEMERRYQLFADAGTKNIGTFNRWVERVRSGEIPPPRATTVEALDHNGDLTVLPASKEGKDGAQLPEHLPFIVIVIDEFADLMMQQGKEVESSVARLAQKARAAGIHLIKANFPSRIAFRVAQRVDSRTILDEQGAEVLLGRGDMLVKLNGGDDTRRVQCPFVSEEEVSALTDHIREQGEPRYEESILAPLEDEGEVLPEDEKLDARFDEALAIVMESGRCSTSWLQRKMTIGYNRAAKIVEMMERRGYVGPPNGSKDREIFFPGS